MKKCFISLLLISVLSLGIVGCGGKANNDGENLKDSSVKKITYSKVETSYVNFEIPSNWKVEENLNESFVATSDNLHFSMIVVKSVSSGQFSYFGETYVYDLLDNMEYTDVVEFNEENFGNYKAYDYVAKTVIQGKGTPVLATALNINGNGVVFMLIDEDESNDYNDVFKHIINSIG